MNINQIQDENGDFNMLKNLDQLMCDIPTNKFSPKIHKILSVLMDNPLLTNMVFDIITFSKGDANKPFSKSLIPLEYHMGCLSDYILMNDLSSHADERIELSLRNE